MSRFRRSIMGSGGLPNGLMLNGSQAQALDVLFSSNDGEQLCIVHGQENWPDSGYTPVGIVVVPGTHNRYGDGTCGIMSLVSMSHDNHSGVTVTSNSQTDSANVTYGGEGQYVAAHPHPIFVGSKALDKNMYYDYIPYQTSSDSYTCSIYGQATNVWPYAGTTTVLTDDASTLYSNDGGYMSSISGEAACDFNGVRNTWVLYRSSGSNVWYNNPVPKPTASGNLGVGDYTGGCTGFYSTSGTKTFVAEYSRYIVNHRPTLTSEEILNLGTASSVASNTGFWYMPALGELCYLPSKRFTINEVITALNQKYNKVGTKLNLSSYGYYWSSSTHSDRNCA